MPLNNPKGGAQWAPEHIAALREHMDKPGKSFTQIADLINSQFGTGYTRNSTIGKASRLGLKSLNPSGVTFSPRKPRKKKPGEVRRKYIRSTHNSTSALRIVREFEIEKLRCAEVVPLNLTFADNDGCWYATGGTAPNHLFCGHDKRAGSSYCTGHHFLCWEPPRRLIDRAPMREAA